MANPYTPAHRDGSENYGDDIMRLSWNNNYDESKSMRIIWLGCRKWKYDGMSEIKVWE